MTVVSSKPVVFIGLGSTGEPMALNLAKAGTLLVVWNRSPSKSDSLEKAGAAVAKTPADVFARSEAVILMLADGAAIDVVLARGAAAFGWLFLRRTPFLWSRSDGQSTGYSRRVGGREVTHVWDARRAW